MTDGIIQKVFKKYFLKYHTFRDMNMPRRNDSLPLDELENMKQELIEEIKKKLSHKTSDMCEYQDLSLHRILDILIGDNQ